MSIISGHYLPHIYPGIMYHLNILDITSKLNELSKESEKLYKVQKELEIINNLNPVTIEILKLAYELCKSANLEDLNKMDNLVKKTLFSSKLENIINE